jgi:hypothetical protein
MEKKLSIIIVSYNSKKNLEKCIKSIYNKLDDSFEWEVIVVNNDKNENLLEIQKKFDLIKLVDSYKNLGFGAGGNLGAKSSTGDLLFFLNPDTEIMLNDTKNIFQKFKTDKNLGIIGAGIFDKEGKKQKWSAGKEISFFNLIKNNLGFSGSKKIWSSSKEIECDWVSGTAMFVRKELFEKVGGFDKAFFMYFEDMDLGKKVRNLGKKVLFYPNFRVFHKGGESWDDFKLQKKHYYDSMEKYLKKHFKFFSLLITKFVRKNFLKK